MDTCYALTHHDDIESHGCCDNCGQWGSQLDDGQPCNCRKCIDAGKTEKFYCMGRVCKDTMCERDHVSSFR